MKLETNDKKALLMGAAGASAVFGILLITGLVFRLTIMPHGSLGRGPIGGGRGGFGMMGDREGMRGMRPVSGVVKTISGNTITIKDQDDQTITVTVDGNTNYYKASNQAKLSDIKTGDALAVFGSLSDSKITATRVVINPDFL